MVRTESGLANIMLGNTSGHSIASLTRLADDLFVLPTLAVWWCRTSRAFLVVATRTVRRLTICLLM